MTSTGNGGSFELATPHIDRTWRERFVVEQRLADRTGAQIGDALATVDAHCAESGETAQEAFGDPAAYSRSLIGDAADEPMRLAPRTVAGIVCGVLSLLILPRAIEALVEGSSFRITGGDVAAAVLLAALVAVIFWRPTPVLRWLVRRPATAGAAVFAVLIVLVVPQALLREALLEVGPVTPLVVGAVLLVLSVVLPWGDLSQQDPVRDPRARETGGGGGIGWFTAFLFPVLTVIMVGMNALFRAVS
ncbi:hypothetical protein [Ornithinimicrobium sp. F0845]|uniref:hypothetical protein n=1 Tax=Ornithinimicrobium sp. F0845 TaxID=2926412 RepID=UPI001FF2EA82|nr:hypothetical protein [Ornithinimicrobium sp. F0845]